MTDAEIHLFDFIFVMSGVLIGCLIAWWFMRDDCDCEEKVYVPDEWVDDVPPRMDKSGDRVQP